jgi:hypothetical protein
MSTALHESGATAPRSTPGCRRPVAIRHRRAVQTPRCGDRGRRGQGNPAIALLPGRYTLAAVVGCCTSLLYGNHRSVKIRAFYTEPRGATVAAGHRHLHVRRSRHSEVHASCCRRSVGRTGSNAPLRRSSCRALSTCPTNQRFVVGGVRSPALTVSVLGGELGDEPTRWSPSVQSRRRTLQGHRLLCAKVSPRRPVRHHPSELLPEVDSTIDPGLEGVKLSLGGMAVPAMRTGRGARPPRAVGPGAGARRQRIR